MEAYLHILHEDFFLHTPLSCVSIAARLPVPRKQGCVVLQACMYSCCFSINLHHPMLLRRVEYEQSGVQGSLNLLPKWHAPYLGQRD